MARQPAGWLVDHVDLIPRGRRVLDVAAGHGRHAWWLAQRGWRVHAIDRDAGALADLEAAARAASLPLTTAVVDLEAPEAPTLGESVFGAIVVVHYLYRPLFPVLAAALEPGGVLIYETFTVGQAQRGSPRNPAFLLDEGELPGLVAPLRVEHAREGLFDDRLIASVVARREPSSTPR